MIQLWSGTPGSGKSLHCAHEVREDLRFKKNVISTCYIDTTYCFMNKLQELIFNISKGKIHLYNDDPRAQNFHYIPIGEITPQYLYEFAAKYHVFGKEHQTTLILDECVAIFSPTVLSENIKRWNEWDEFFRKHRHLGYNVIIIPQSKKLISRKVIEYCEFEVKHYNRKHHGNFGWILAMVIGGLFSYSVCWRGTRDKPLEQKFFTYRRLFGSMYNSYSMFDETLQPYKEAEKKRLMQEMANTLAGYAKRQELPERQRLMSELCKNLIERRNQLEAIETNNGSNLCASDCC